MPDPDAGNSNPEKRNTGTDVRRDETSQQVATTDKNEMATPDQAKPSPTIQRRSFVSILTGP